MVEKKTNGQKIHEYVYNVKPVLNKGGLFADGSKYYVSPQEPDADQDVKVRFRTTADNVDEVFLIYNEEKVQMTKESSNRIFDFYNATIPGGLPFIRYHFEIHSGRVTCFYDKLGPTKQNDREYDFEICPGFKVPEWAKGAVFYQIFVDRFCNGDLSNDVLDNEYAYIGAGSVQVKDWNQRPSTMDVGRFYGGDLQGVMDKLDYLQDLGVDVIYLNPIFVSPSNHKYDIQDYDYVDPHFGRIVDDEGDCLPGGCLENKQSPRYINRVTNKKNLEASNQLFAELVEEIHKRGMKVIVCGSAGRTGDKKPRHSGGKNLFQIADYVVDTCCPLQDASVTLKNHFDKIGPLSTMASITCVWMIITTVCEILADRGMKLHINPSHNIPGDTTARERLAECIAAYKESVKGC